MHKILDNVVPVAQNVLSSSVVYNAAIDPSTSQGSEAVIQDEALQNQEMYDTSVERPLVQSTKIALSTTTVCDADGSQDLQLHASENLLVQTTRSILNDGEEREESHDSDIHLSKILFNQTITSMVADYKEEIIFSAIGTQETDECKRRFSVHHAQNVLSPTVVHDTETNEAIEKSLIRTTEEAENPATIQDIASGTQETHDTFHADQETESLAKARDTEESHDSSIGSQEMCSTVKKRSISAAQNIPSSTKIPNAATMHPSPSQAPKLATPQNTAVIDPSPSKAPEPMTSSILESNTYNDYKWFSDIPKQNLPHLEAGVKRHPQVLDWFNTNRQRLFATLFIEVTCILRTTRRCDLTEDDQNHIRKCCAALEAVGFDACWLNYVHGCIESCGDGDELMRKLEETEAKASTLRNELASIEASLLSLRDEASRLHNFIEP
ncbi:uncharacterized protein LOC114737245 [Neltuma alba]|uniref:uncharacterized protein LOC114737245 n=1 Tax=Neltuma alba TaxID=207710 RepID=UPI0010A55F8E|nr:uncharacterized protein LOC114737245 [Prosopis alba]